MYTIILVEDEETVRKGIRGKTAWGVLGFEVIGEAGNGIEALELIEEHIPDIVISDVQMPYMDGITLIETIHIRYPSIATVIISGFDEFSYAQAAISFNVYEYILKPVSSEDIKQLLLRLKKRLDTEIAELNNIETLKKNYNQVLPQLKEKFLLSLLTSSNAMEKQLIIDKIKFYNFPISGDSFVVAVIDIEQPNTLENEKQNFTAIAMNSIVNDAIKDDEHAVAIFVDWQINIIFSGITQHEIAYERLFIKQIFRKLENIQLYIVKYLSITPLIGIGNITTHLGQITNSYKGAIESLNYAFTQNDQSILFINDIHSSKVFNTTLHLLDNQTKPDLSAAIRFGSSDDIERVTSFIFEEISKNPTFESIQNILLFIISLIYEIASSHGMQIHDIFNDSSNTSIFTELININSIPKALRWTLKKTKILQEAIHGVRKNSNILFVEESKRIIFKQFADPGFNQESLCDMLGISPSYFSSTFKKEVGDSFVQYLTKLRMEKAKELLKNTELKTYHISEAIGINEPNYFSYCFKRYEGVSPSQYRQSQKNNE